MSTASHYHKIVAPILRWYRRHGRKLPWRNISDPYRITMAEIMLQQTQVSRVLAKYPEFLRRFPTFRSLARAEVRDVIVAWRGMGYNTRAVRLHALARTIVNKHGARLPDGADILQQLPGIGRYTAHALLCSVHGAAVPIVDVNVRRFFSRLFFRMRSLNELRREGDIWAIAEEVLPRRRAYEWNQALMDIGATVCTALQPACEQCPVARRCASRHRMGVRRMATRKSEPGLEGIPNRIYRGRIVEELRRAGGKQRLTAGEIGRRIYPGYGARQHLWLDSLLRSLEADGLIAVRRTPGSTAVRVSLA